MKTIFTAALAFCCLFLAAKTQAQTAYTIQDLGVISDPYVNVSGLNNEGDVVANAFDNASTYTTLLYSNGVLQDITAKAGTQVGNINDNGLIATSTGVPVMFGEGYTGQAALYNTRTATLQTLGVNSPYGSVALAVNQAGDAAGTMDLGNSQYHAAYYHNGQTTDLGVFPGGGYTEATALNNRGEVVGGGSIANADEHAFLYSGGVLRDLGTLPGGQTAVATGINDSGVVGYSEFGTRGITHAFLYQNGAMQDLGTLGGPSSGAYGINNAGVVVGSTYTKSTSGTLSLVPFVYSGGVMRNLFDMIPDPNSWYGGFAEAVNDNGQIAGVSYHNGRNVIFLATPVAVPAPGSALTFGVGIGVMLLAARRRKRSAAVR